MQIQYISDIHLETRKHSVQFKDILDPIAPYLVLAGDIGNPLTPNYEEFLKYCSDNFKLIFYVLGNHEFYNSYRVEKLLKNRKFITDKQFQDLSEKLELDSVESRLRKIRGVCSKYPNIRLLNQDSAPYKIPDSDYIVIGCTLWSKLKMEPYNYLQFNDFFRICEDNNTLLHPNTYIKWNESDKEYIKKTLISLYEENTNYKIIMVTHHCPTYDILQAKYLDNDTDNMNSFFANDDEELLKTPSIKLWICGHTHGCKKIIVNNTIIATNTYGYDGENIEGFSNKAVIEI